MSMFITPSFSIQKIKVRIVKEKAIKKIKIL